MSPWIFLTDDHNSPKGMGAFHTTLWNYYWPWADKRVAFYLFSRSGKSSMYQTSLTPFIVSHQSSTNRGFYSNLQINSLIEEKKIIRIVRPALQSEIEARYPNGRFPSYIIQHRGQLFLSLQSITNFQQRETTFSILRCYQIDDTIDISQLPTFIRQILGESASNANSFVTPD